MKFQIIPDQIGQVIRSCKDMSNSAEFIVTNLTGDEEKRVECVELRDLQRNVSASDRVTKHLFQSSELTVIANNLEKYIHSWNGLIPRPEFIKAYFIENLDDVEEYFHDIHSIYDSSLHPDDDFRNLTDQNDNATFTAEEANYLNSIMVQCFDICNKNDVDLYEIACKVQTAVWAEKGLGLNS